jgi:hypothetical protein
MFIYSKDYKICFHWSQKDEKREPFCNVIL